MNIIALTLCLMLITLACPAEAYLDPAAGNAIVYGLVALAGAGIYAVKGAYYWAAKRVGVSAPPAMDASLSADAGRLALFSEGAQILGKRCDLLDLRKNQLEGLR